MDRSRLIREIIAKGIPVDGDVLKVVKELGRGGNGVAFRCTDSHGNSIVAKIYIPPDNRDLDERSLNRFEREIKLTTTLRHPNVIRALGSGTLKIGAYTLPFYTMPLAPKTLRDIMRSWTDADSLDRLLRVFLKAARGVVFLHSNEVVHRDLKPENILIAEDGTPWVADLGIAHVNPQFASDGLKTIEREHLLNRDYYAPEQRFGSAVDVDHRADIYALGCILYELILGTPPVRNNSPTLSSRNEALGYLDPIFNRMTAYAVSDRYDRLEDSLDDLAIQFGFVLAILQGARPAISKSLPSMLKLLRSSNEIHRRKGIELARELGPAALDSLHELLGHGRREVRNAAALALGEIADESSMTFLVGAMYGTSNKASSFRPSADSASIALSRYPAELRLKACSEIRQFVRPFQLKQVIDGVPTAGAYDLVLSLVERGVLLLDWGETELDLLVSIDEDRAWPAVQSLLDMPDNWKLRSVLRHLSPVRQVECMRLWLPKLQDAWFLKDIFEAARSLKGETGLKVGALRALLARVDRFPTRFDAKDAMLKQILLELDAVAPQVQHP